MIPTIGFQSTMDKPDSVNLVSPPIIIIIKTSNVRDINQTRISIFEFDLSETIDTNYYIMNINNNLSSYFENN